MASIEPGMKSVILCGGQGSRLQEATRGLLPKPMLTIGDRPILQHIMHGYARHGIKDFILCLGHLGHIIKDYFLHYSARNSDITVDLSAPGQFVLDESGPALDWRVTLAETGEESMTGARLARVKKYLSNGTFMLTYGDGVADVDLEALLAFHRAHGRIATVTGVMPPGRFGKLEIEGSRVKSFEEKPLADGAGRINGGFLVFEPGIFEYVTEEQDCILEREPLMKLAMDGELMVYSHNGFWQCMDTYRDLILLQKLWDEGNPPWLGRGRSR